MLTRYNGWDEREVIYHDGDPRPSSDMLVINARALWVGEKLCQPIWVMGTGELEATLIRPQAGGRITCKDWGTAVLQTIGGELAIYAEDQAVIRVRAVGTRLIVHVGERATARIMLGDGATVEGSGRRLTIEDRLGADWVMLE